MKISLSISYISLTFNHGKNWQNLRPLLLRPLPKFCRKVWKIFLTQPFGLSQIFFHFVLFINQIFCYAQILQLLTAICSRPYWCNVSPCWCCHKMLWHILNMGVKSHGWVSQVWMKPKIWKHFAERDKLYLTPYESTQIAEQPF